MKTKTRFHKLTAWLLTLAMLMTFMPCFTLMASAEDSCDGIHTLDLNGDCTVCTKSILDITYSGDNYTGISVKLASFDAISATMTLPDNRGEIRVDWYPDSKRLHVHTDEDIRAAVPRFGDGCIITEVNEGTIFENGVGTAREDLAFGDAYYISSDAENVYVTLNEGYDYYFYITPGYTADGYTDEEGHVNVNELNVLVNDELGAIANAYVKYNDDNTITVTLPAEKTITYENRITVTVTDSIGGAVKDKSVTVLDVTEKSYTALTDENGKVVVPPVNTDMTDAEGKGVVNGYDVVIYDETKPIENAYIEIVDGVMSVVLPEGVVFDYHNRITAEIKNADGNPVKDIQVNFTDSNKNVESVVSDENGKVQTGGGTTDPVTTYYDLWVGGTRVTSANASDVFNDGKVSFTPAEGETPATLTLNNYTYSGAGYNNAAIDYAGTDVLNLELVGENSVTQTGTDSSNSVGVYANGDITVSGTGSLTGTSGAAEFFSYGVYAYGDITVSGTGSLTGTSGAATSQSYGVYALGDIKINGGVTEAQGETQAFYKAPKISDTFTNAAVWYGDSADNTQIGTVDNYSAKYVKIAADSDGGGTTDPAPEAPNNNNFYGSIFEFACNTKSYKPHQTTGVGVDTSYCKVAEPVKNEAGEWTSEVTYNVKKAWGKWIIRIYVSAYPDNPHAPHAELPEALTVTLKWDSEKEKWVYEGEDIVYDISCEPITASYSVEIYTMDTTGAYGAPEIALYTANIGETVSYTAADKTGFTVDVDASVLEDVLAEQGTVLKVYYIRNQYTFKVVVDDETVSETDYYYEAAVTAPETPTKTGYTFAGWDKQIPATMPAEDLEITAQWEANEYTITFIVDGEEYAKITQDYGTDITAPADPTKTGYTFNGWDKEIPSTMPAENMTITAQWTINQYTITFDTDGGTTVDPITLDYGADITAPADPTKTGYTFNGWDKEIPSTMPAENMTITAKWTVNQYTVTFDTDGGTTVDPITLDYGADITAPADPTKTGYTFNGWDKEIPSTMPAENMTITAQWTINQYTVTYKVDGVQVGEIETYDYDASVAIREKYTKTGYTVTDWSITEGFNMPAQNMTITATSTVNQYTVTYKVDGVQVGEIETYDYDENVSIREKYTKTGYTVTDWSITEGFNMPAQNVEINATSTVNQYTITFAPDGGTAVAPITQDYNTAVEKPADPTKIGYDFGGWYADSALTTAYVFSTMPAENITVYAKWSPATGTAYTVKHYHQNTSGSGYTLYESETLRGTTNAATAAEVKNYPGFTAQTFTQTTILPDGTAVVEIKYDRNTYAVTLVANRGTIRDGDVTEYTYGIGAKLPTNVTRGGYYFGGWYDNEDCKGNAVTEISTTDIGDKTFYAKWNFIYIPIITPTYSPVVDGGNNGDVTVSPKNPAKGDTVIITPDPDKGYEVDEVIVTDKNGKPVTVVDNGDGTYSFKQPNGKATITVTFDEINEITEVDEVDETEKIETIEKNCTLDNTCPMHRYTDLDMTAWYHEGVHFCLENGLMNGTGADTFAPDMTTSRAMIVTILWRLEGEPVVNYAMDFDDVAADTWYTEAIRWAASEGIVNGYSDTAFGPNDAITREQLATILYRYEQYKGGGFTGAWMIRMDYVDLADVSDWAYEAMCWMNMNGIVNGKPGKVLDPKGSATRAESATMLYRYCEVMAKEDDN